MPKVTQQVRAALGLEPGALACQARVLHTHPGAGASAHRSCRVATHSSGLWLRRPELGWCGAAEDRVTCLERVPLRNQPLPSLAGGHVGKAGCMEDARESTMEGFSHLTPPLGLLTPWLWAEDDGGGQRREGSLGGSARQGRAWVAAGLWERLLACLEGCAQAGLLPASLSSSTKPLGMTP